MNYDEWKTHRDDPPESVPMQTVQIEMTIPADIDPSEVLERMQEIAVEMCEEHATEINDHDPEDDDGPTFDRDEVTNAVSVKVIG